MRSPLLPFLVVALLAPPAFAKSHLWKFTEVFSNADGSIQFIEMFVFDPAGTGEWRIQNKTLESDANLFVFPHDLPEENTFERWLLIATPAFAALPDAPTPDYFIPPQFFDPAGDELRYGTALDVLDLPAGAVPTDGIQAYLRDGSTAVNSPINFAGVEGSVDASQPCADGVDNDGDGAADHPADPGCGEPSWPTESPECQDGINNDPGQDALIDWDGGGSAGLPPAEQTAPDPQCGSPWQTSERPPKACGLGAEVALGLPLLLTALARRRAAARRRTRG